LKVVMDGGKHFSGGYSTIDETCSSRRQGINGWDTTGSRYVQSARNI